MTINLNDKKIVKIIYALNDFCELHLCFDDGEIVGVKREYKGAKNCDKFISEMLPASRKLANEIIKQTRGTISKNTKDESTTPKAKEENYVKSLVTAKKLVEMECNGEIDKIANDKINGFIDNKKEVVTSEEPHIYERVDEDKFERAIDKMGNSYGQKSTKNDGATEESYDIEKRDSSVHDLISETTKVLIELEKNGKLDEIQNVKAFTPEERRSMISEIVSEGLKNVVN